MLKTKNGQELDVVELSFKDICKLIAPVNPELAKTLKTTDATDSGYRFYKASYRYGSKIIGSQKCFLPLKNGGSIDLNDADLPNQLKQDLSYDPATEDPLAIVISKNSEFYLPSGDRIMSHKIIHPGELFGIPRAIDTMASDMPPANSSLISNLNAGARFIFLLVKVAARHRYDKLLKNSNIDLEVPSSNSCHWPNFVAIAKQANSDWRSEVIFFPRQWIKQLKHHDWSNVSNQLLKQHRSLYNIWHNKALIWTAIFNDIEQQKSLNSLSNYAISTARQLFYIAANSAIGVRAATNDESAPITLIRDVYTNGYGLIEEEYSNLIMESATFNQTNNNPIYYSLNYPMLAQHNPDTFKGKSIITLLNEVHQATNVYQQTILKELQDIQSLYEIANSTSFRFYHCNNDQPGYKNIHDSAILAAEDPQFSINTIGDFPEHSAFFKGCIKIAATK